MLGTDGEIQRISQFVAKFVEFSHRCQARMNPYIIFMKEMEEESEFLLRQMDIFFFKMLLKRSNKAA